MLASILKKEELEVNSRHHDYVIQTDLDVVATSTDVIEAVEDNEKTFFIGVQWHPEYMLAFPGPNTVDPKKLFDHFITLL